MPPIASPPPNSTNAPHSMPATASFHDSVNSRRSQLTGNRNNNSAPPIAATASGNNRLYIFKIGSVGPSARLKKPGVIHSMTAVKNAINVFL